MLGWVGLDGCNGWVDGWMGGWMMDEVSSVDEVCSNFFFMEFFDFLILEKNEK